jgi:hypothetical protein
MTAANDRAQGPIGATIGLFFGGLWCVLGSQALPQGWRMAALVAGWIVTALLIVQVWRRPGAGNGGSAMFRRRAYLVAVVLEVAAIVAAGSVLPRAGLGDELIPAIGIIVGLHFLGLWKATDLRRFVAIALAMCAVSLLAALLPLDWHGIDARIAACGFGNALVLWAGAGLAL